MKYRAISKEAINKIELRVEDIYIPPNDTYGFQGYLLKEVLVPYVDGQRVGGFKFYKRERKRMEKFYEIRYTLCIFGINHRLSRVAYIILNKNDPRVVETKNSFYIANNLLVDHDEDELIKGKKFKFIIKPDTQENLQLLDYSGNAKKAKKRMNELPRYVCYEPTRSSWTFFKRGLEPGEPDIKKSFRILTYGWEDAYIKVINYCNKVTGSNHIPDLNQAIPESCKGMSEREAHIKYNWHWVEKRRKENLQQSELDLDMS